MHMASLPDVTDCLADVLTVFENRLSHADILQCQLMAEWYNLCCGHADGFIGFHHPTADFFTCADLVNHDHPDTVFRFMNYEMWIHPDFLCFLIDLCELYYSTLKRRVNAM